jgi:hypothetical protein
VGKRGRIRVKGYIFLYGKGNENRQLGTGFFTSQNSMQLRKWRLLAIGCHM